jgi:hypothetical protein
MKLLKTLAIVTALCSNTAIASVDSDVCTVMRDAFNVQLDISTMGMMSSYNCDTKIVSVDIMPRSDDAKALVHTVDKRQIIVNQILNDTFNTILQEFTPEEKPEVKKILKNNVDALALGIFENAETQTSFNTYKSNGQMIY